MTTLSEWLVKDCQAFDVRPCKVTIGKSTYDAARYKQTFQTPGYSEAWRRGERVYTREQVYCVGHLPAAYHRSARTCFRFIGDDRDWYVSCYCPADTARDPRVAQFHPFGETFMLAPWSVPDGTAIDHYEPRPYKRVAATVDYREDNHEND